MTVDEIYEKIATHMVEGMMLHDDMANYYDFLGLCGYKRCHEYHFLAEACAYRGIWRYYINHHGMLIPHGDTEYSSVIPMDWYSAKRDEVDESTKRSAVRKGMTAWVNWEKETKALYEKSYYELLELGEIASAGKIMDIICDVDHELKVAERYLLDSEAIGYDMMWIISEQKRLHDKYEKKMEEEIKVTIC